MRCGRRRALAKRVRRWASRLGLFACAGAFGCAARGSRSPGSAFDFRRPGANFELDGAPLCFVGANNYYLAYQPRAMVDDVLESARAMGVRVVRTWGFIDRGSLDGRVPSIDGDGTKRGFYFQAWDPDRKHALYNDGPAGLAGLDYALYEARRLKLKIVLVLTNNWREFGGMDQYLAWFGDTRHDDFYRDVRLKQAYRDWLWHLTSHINVYTGEAYRDDPTVFGWELANEPRAPLSTPSRVIDDWADEMSSYLKSIDRDHLVAVGDEGFFDLPSEQAEVSQHWTYHANNGVDHRALSALSNVDYATFHMYPGTWGTGFSWPERWIDDHLRVARELGKPTVLEEYGLAVTRDELGRVSTGLSERLRGYAAWNERVLNDGGGAAMFWMLAGRAEGAGAYPDYDHFSVYPGDRSSELLRGFASRFAKGGACENSELDASAIRSPFVRVRSARRSAVGWVPTNG